jgi:transketolase C-terminal domain/subunit
VRVLSEGDDLCVVSSGICTEQAMRALAAVGDAGVSSPTCTPAP